MSALYPRKTYEVSWLIEYVAYTDKVYVIVRPLLESCITQLLLETLF
jgi:hypothetical protein